MNLPHWMLVYGTALATFLVVDLVWLGVVARGLYRSQMGDLLAESPRMVVAFVFYALFVVGLCYFAIAPAVDSGSWSLALRNGALYGFFTYATYDLTNLAVLRGFPTGLVFVDIAWGVVLSTTVTAAAFGVAQRVT